jgi:hypothetical protein
MRLKSLKFRHQNVPLITVLQEIVIAYCLENQFTYQDLCDKNHERQVETRVQALLVVVVQVVMVRFV